MVVQSKIKIEQNIGGTFSVLALDSNGVWVLAEPGQCVFETEEEAAEYADRWLDLNPKMEDKEE